MIRGYDPAHRLFRGRRTTSYVQMTASDIAKQVAQRAGLKVGDVDATSTVFAHVSQAGQTDWELLEQLARESGYEMAVRDGHVLVHRADHGDRGARPPAGPTPNPLVLELGTDLLRFRSVLTSAQQAGKMEVRGWDVATKQALTATAPARTRSADLPTVTPADLAKAFGDPTHVVDRRALPDPGRGGRGGQGAGRRARRRLRRVRGRGPGQPGSPGRRGDHASTGSASRSTASTP